MCTDGFDDELRSRWENILADADIKSVPINFLKDIHVKMFDGTEKTFDVEELKKNGFSYKDIEKQIEDFVSLYDDEIDSLDFHINLELIAKEVGKKTRKLLDD